MFLCEVCNKSFTSRDIRQRHVKIHNKTISVECIVCGEYFNRVDSMKRHLTTVHNIIKRVALTDPQCNVTMNAEASTSNKKRANEDDDVDDKDNTSNNAEQQQQKPKRARTEILCEVCGVLVDSTRLTGHRNSYLHKENMFIGLRDNIELCKSAFQKRICSYKLNNTDHSNLDVALFLQSSKPDVLDLLMHALERFVALKFNLELFADFYKIKGDNNNDDDDNDDDDETVTELKSFNTKSTSLTRGSDPNVAYDEMAVKIKRKTEEFQEVQSGWALRRIRYIELNIMKYNPLRASNYIELPKKILDKHAIINVMNNDQACFAWSIMSALYPEKTHPQRPTSYVHYSKVLNFKNITFPVKIKDVSKFESQNNNISVNVYALNEKDDVIVLYVTSKRKCNHVNLLYLCNGEGKTHYAWIKHLSRLVRSQLTAHHGRIYLCDGCLVSFANEFKLQRHQEQDCGKVCVSLPTADIVTDRLGRQAPGNMVKFKNQERKMTVPFVIYADSESYLQPILGCTPDSSKSYVQALQKHTPYSFGYYVKCSYDDALSTYRFVRGADCIDNFIDLLVADVKRLAKITHTIVPMRRLEADERRRIYSATVCSICGDKFTEHDIYNKKVVLDHDHLTGEPNGLAHNACNINYKLPKFIPIFFHNLDYDVHLFIIKLAEKYNKISVIPLNKEKYISMSVKIPINEEEDDENNGDYDRCGADDCDNDNKKKYVELRFLDSFRFLSCGLDKIAKTLTDDDCVEMKRLFSDSKQFKLLRRKGFFPYEYVDSLVKLTETNFPDIKVFASKLKRNSSSEVSKKDYTHALNVWRCFNCNTLGDYSDIYLKTDVMILADAFEKFRHTTKTHYDLDPAHYFTTPGLSWDCMLKFTNVQLELLTDIDMLHFIRRALRGGISQCSKRYSEANHKYMRDYDKNKPSTYIVYLDCNNQYGWSLSQAMPYGGFKWLPENEIVDFDFKSIASDADEGCFLEVDLQYPTDLHDLHKDLPFCAQQEVPILSKSKQTKLLATVADKHKYILHYRNLQQCVQHGLRLTKIHRVLTFKQNDFLKPYIDANTDLRKLATSDFEKDLYKLFNNSIFGKSVESVEKRLDVKLIGDWKNKGKNLDAETLISRPNFHSISVFNENFVAVQLKRLTVKYDKPNYIGLAVLDVSKTIMYDFLYSYMKPKYDNNVRLCYSDTDSFIFEVCTDDFYDDIRDDVHERFDTSNFPINNPYELPLVNKKVLGKFKFEVTDNIIKFVGLRSKLYAYLTDKTCNNNSNSKCCDHLTCDYDEDARGSCFKKSKGVKKDVVATLKFHDYLRCLKSKKNLMCSMCVFRSIKHEVYTQEINKIGLSAHDDKRFLIPGTHDTLPWSHYKI